MDPSPAPEGGDGAWRYQRPRLPWIVTATSLVVAVGAVSLLIYVLYRETTGPGEVARDFLEAVRSGDCEAAAELAEEAFGSQALNGCPDLPLGEGPIDVVQVRASGEALDRAEVLLEPHRRPDCVFGVRLVEVDGTWLVNDLRALCPRPAGS
jgi:hypothetical protein